MIQAYNTWLAEDYCSVAPDRLIAVGVIPTSGIDDAVSELKRCKQLGLKGVFLSQFPNGSGLAKPEDDRFWEAALTERMPIAPHVTFGGAAGDLLGISGGAPSESPPVVIGSGGHQSLFPLLQLMYHGVFDRFPELRIYFAETQAHWLPAAVWQLDDNYERYSPSFGGLAFKMPPSEYVKKHARFSVVRDPIAFRYWEQLPLDILMWGSDLPHQTGSFPESRSWIDRTMGGVPDTVRRRILLENPAEFFGLDLESPITPTPKG